MFDCITIITKRAVSYCVLRNAKAAQNGIRLHPYKIKLPLHCYEHGVKCTDATLGTLTLISCQFSTGSDFASPGTKAPLFWNS